MNMKNIYALVILFAFLFSASATAQNRIYPPNLRAPEDGQMNQSPDVILDWDAVTGQSTDITYQAQLATNPDFNDAIDFPRTELTAQVLDNLRFGDVYYWRVKAFDADEPSDWSETWSFQIVKTVTVTSPKIGKMVYANPEIKWDPITGLKNYQMQLDTVYDWMVEPAATTSDFLGTFVLDENNSWVVGEGGSIQYFDGTSWTEQDAGTSENLNAVYFVDAGDGYAVGDKGTVLHFDGTAWSLVDAGTTEDLFSVFFIDSENGWAVGANGTVLNYSSGTWSLSNPVTQDIFGVYALNNNNVWACGKGKIVLHYNGTEWSDEVVGTRDHNAIWFTDENNGWVVGKSGKIDHYNGSEWISQPSGINKELYGLSFNSSVGYAVGAGGYVVEYIGEWQQVASGTEEDLNAVWLNGDAGYMAGNAGTLIRKTNSGFTSPYAHIINVPYDSANIFLENLPFGASVYYRMRAMTDNDTSIWSGTRLVNTYATVELKKPNDGLTDADLAQLFSWNTYDGSTQYFYEIADNENYENPFTFSTDSTSLNFTTSYFNTKWWWHVRAAHLVDISDWSESFTFTTINSVTLENPEDNATEVTFCPLYRWQEIEGVSSYQIWIDTVADFSTATKETTKTPLFQCASPLKRKTLYYWKVRAISTLDSSDFSPVWSFTTEGYTGIEDHFGDNSIWVYPNPNKGDFTLRIYSPAGETYQVTVLDLVGKQIYQQEMFTKPGDNEINLNLPDVKAGLYMLHIKKGNDEVSKKLFVN